MVLYDRSGVDEIPEAFEDDYRSTRPEVLVCTASTCRAAGAEAVLTEIEELADCVVKGVGCLGYCSEAPNALVRKNGMASVHTKLRTIEKSLDVVKKATGKVPGGLDAKTKQRLEKLRAERARRHAISVYHWNAALKDSPAERDDDLRRRVETMEGYVQWSLVAVVPMSKYSAVYRFTSSDRKRGTPHPRGSGRMADPVTWHTTLLAEIGSNSEGPLPWIEREYTPISSAKEWEQGRVDILVKIYDDGKATSWIHGLETNAKVWLSKPVRTLSMPSLTEDESRFRPGSVLLVLGGTGVVALPQILYHRRPIQHLAISTPRRSQLHVPIDLILSCREDDILLLAEIAAFCKDGLQNHITGLRQCTLLLTPAKSSQKSFFVPPTLLDPDVLFRDLPNARIVRSRLSPPILAKAVAHLQHPSRVVVSGPDNFNITARAILSDLLHDDHITVLSA